MPLVIGLHLDIELLTATLWVWPSSQFLIHWVIHPSNSRLYNLETRMSCGTASNALLRCQADDISFSYTIW